MTEPTLDWQLSLEGGGAQLRIGYTVKNPLRKRIYICSQLVQRGQGGKFSRSNRAVVKNSEVPGVIQIVLGRVSSDAPSATLYSPPYEPIEPGSSFSGSLLLPLPLKEWHPSNLPNPLSKDAKKVSFEVHMFKGEPPEWRTLPSDESTPLKVPEGYGVFILKTEPKPLPTTSSGSPK